MRPTKIFVDGINNRVRQVELQSLFTQYGRVTECDIISNFGFVHMADEDDARNAIRNLDHHKLQGGTLSVMMSRSNGQPADRNRFRRGNYRRPAQGPMFSNRNTFGSRPDPYSNRYRPSSMGRYDSRDRRDNRDGRDSYRDPYDRRGPPPSHRGRDMSPPTNGRPRDHPMRGRSPRDRSPRDRSPPHGDPYGVRQDEYGRLVATSREEEERYAAMRRDGRENRPGQPAQYYDEVPREHAPSRSQRPEYDYPSQSRGDGRYHPHHEGASQQRYSSRSTSSSRSDSRDRARRPVHRDSSGSRRRSPSPRRRQRNSTGSSASSASSRSASPRQRQRQRRPVPSSRHARRHSSESSSPRRRASSRDSSQSPPPPSRRHRGRPPSPPSPPSSPENKPRRQRSTHDVSEVAAKKRRHQEENDSTVAPPPEPVANNSDSGSPKRRRKHKDRTKSRSSKKKLKKTASGTSAK